MTTFTPGALLTTLALGTALAGCTSDRPATAQPSHSSASPAEEVPEVLATIGSERITMDEIREVAGDELDQMESRYRRARHKAVETALQQVLRDRMHLEEARRQGKTVDELIRAEARRQGKTVDELIRAEAGGNLDPSGVEIAAWYEDNHDRVGGRGLEQIHSQIADHLRQERREAAMEKLDGRLSRERGVTVHLRPFRVPLDNAGAPAMGPEDAPVTLVEFSDFQCPYCGRFHPALARLRQTFGDTLRVVYRQFPLTSIHPNAFKAAEASLCAHGQGRFWEMHDAMFQAQERLAVADLKRTAARLGLDQREFGQCLDTGRYAARVQEDLREGNRAGVTGTPALFVNGVPLDVGVVPFDVVAKAIRQEAGRAGPRSE